ncbi:MAG: DNA primase [Vicinamibacterales bacterium]
MALLPQNFIEDLKLQADIVTVIQDYVSLKKVGATYKGLCPFHGEKTPSFHVNRDKGFFHCFGCNVGGDVIKFVELHEKVGFFEAVKLIAGRFGITVPEPEQTDEQRASSAERESLLAVHEAAAKWFREQLATPAGARIRTQIADRGVTDATSEVLGLGFAPPGRDGLTRHLLKIGFAQSLLVRGGLAFEREDRSLVDRFRSRLMVPIARDSGAIVAFGGRAVDSDQQPKYLNSPETPIYTKSRTLYGLHLSKAAIRERKFAVLVEGYFDFAQVYQSGQQAVVASCGTALTAQQAALLRRFAGRVVLSYDPDAAGQGAAARSSELLVAEGFDVNVAVLPAGEDPDVFIRRHGGAEYVARLKQSRPYLDFLLDRAAAGVDPNTADGRANLVAAMVPVGSRIPDTVRRQIFAEAVASRARVPLDLVLKEFTRAASGPSGKVEAAPAVRVRPLGQLTKAERALLWMLVHQPEMGISALKGLEMGDLDGLGSRPVLDLARKLNENNGFSSAALLEQLDMAHATLLTEAAAESEAPSLDAVSCVRALRKLRYERERVANQLALDRLQAAKGSMDPGVDTLLNEKRFLIAQIEALKDVKE